MKHCDRSGCQLVISEWCTTMGQRVKQQFNSCKTPQPVFHTAFVNLHPKERFMEQWHISEPGRTLNIYQLFKPSLKPKRQSLLFIFYRTNDENKHFRLSFFLTPQNSKTFQAQYLTSEWVSLYLEFKWCEINCAYVHMLKREILLNLLTGVRSRRSWFKIWLPNLVLHDL